MSLTTPRCSIIASPRRYVLSFISARESSQVHSPRKHQWSSWCLGIWTRRTWWLLACLCRGTFGFVKFELRLITGEPSTTFANDSGSTAGAHRPLHIFRSQRKIFIFHLFNVLTVILSREHQIASWNTHIECTHSNRYNNYISVKLLWQRKQAD